MAELFKDVYCPAFYDQFSGVLTKVLPEFDTVKFNQMIFNECFADYELKQRMHHTAEVLHYFMPVDFSIAVGVLKSIIEELREQGIKEQSIEYMFLPAYIEMYGIDDYDRAVDGFEFVTQYTSCEFAVRPFIIRYSAEMLAQMQTWTTHESRHVRRLASEGSRPRLPWAMALPELKNNPSPLLPILTALKQDECEVVRRSVANNLNDIAKDNSDVVVQIATQWLGHNEETDKLVKHACRTLLKQAQPDIMALFGFQQDLIKLTAMAITTPVVKVGDKLHFDFTIENTNNQPQKLRLEYGLYYLKKNGSLARKVFKISERIIAGNTQEQLSRHQSFKVISTRVFHLGIHKLTIIINGQESGISSEEKLLYSFELMD
ncbi:DNA alkylation repair protein [Moritella sp. Urea-trap-13]|uniref:DNA alkylation repair protein n=1 Tax=Moritella sp. Urea-trap-13 TaxID=2058327 RepID=UPI000C33E1A9|nr:DNA alkylation repair protein [Moritella sp. Urea-trap-13]PKH06093.1 DNA alkylation repair protein [Moritella sp. Urea-trap-13]